MPVNEITGSAACDASAGFTGGAVVESQAPIATVMTMTRTSLINSE